MMMAIGINQLVKVTVSSAGSTVANPIEPANTTKRETIVFIILILLF